MHHDPFLVPPEEGVARFRSSLLLLTLFAVLVALVLVAAHVAGEEHVGTSVDVEADASPERHADRLEVVYIDPETGELRPTPPEHVPVIDLTIRVPLPPRFESVSTDIEIAGPESSGTEETAP